MPKILVRSSKKRKNIFYKHVPNSHFGTVHVLVLSSHLNHCMLNRVFYGLFFVKVQHFNYNLS
jgi:hypothetical protein